MGMGAAAGRAGTPCRHRFPRQTPPLPEKCWSWPVGCFQSNLWFGKLRSTTLVGALARMVPLTKLEEFVTIREAARCLGAAPNTFPNWHAAGKIAVYRNPTVEDHAQTHEQNRQRTVHRR
jgi:hypothetical protein